ncbi:predicted protein [Histoplasma capsulatum var. duboisii H88]|uniref:Predicted protein n=1 Tax=Ajellomyces capsulatus (strain H88) TaxID=544711 RepID=F0U9C8_AJEC8|nr:predicted protein [Histoplasma capsulatum var. duboisii H88]
MDLANPICNCRVRFLISGQSSTHNWEMDFRYRGKDSDYDDTFAKKRSDPTSSIRWLGLRFPSINDALPQTMSCIVSLWIVTGVAVQRQVTISSSPLGHLFEWSGASVLTEEGQIPRFVRASTFLQTDGYDRLTPPIATFKNDLGS